MAFNFKNAIDAAIGVDIDDVDPTAIETFINDACYDIYKRVSEKDKNEAFKFLIKSAYFDDNDIDTDEKLEIVAVERDGYFANQGNFLFGRRYADSGSIYTAAKESPIWYIDNKVLYVWPVPSDSERSYYYHVPDWTVASYSTGSGNIPDFPHEYYRYAALYAAVHATKLRMGQSVVPTAPTFISLPVAPSSLEDASISYTDATSGVVVSIDIEDFSTAPSYSGPSEIVMPSLNYDTFPSISWAFPSVPIGVTLTDNSVSFSGTPPVYNQPVLVPPDFSEVTQALASMTIPSGIVMPSLSIDAFPGVVWSFPSAPIVPQTANASVTLTGNPSIYVSPIVPTVLSVSAAKPIAPIMELITYTGPTQSDIGVAPMVSTTSYVLPSVTEDFDTRFSTFTELTDFNVTAVPPSPIDDPAISGSASGATIADISANLPVYLPVSISSASLGPLTTETIDDLVISAVAPVIPSIDTVSYSTVATTDMDEVFILSPADITVGDGTAGTFDETVVDSKAPTYTKSGIPVPSSITSELAAMKALIDTDEDPELSSAKATEIQSILSSFAPALQAFQAAVTDERNKFDQLNVIYQQEIQEEVSNTQAANNMAIQNLQKDLQVAQANFANAQKRADTDSSNSLAKAQLEAQQSHQAKMQDAVQAMQEIVNENQSKMSQYSQEVATYNSLVDTEVKEYQQNLTKTLEIWKSINTTILQEHSQRVQDSLNSFNADNTHYQAYVQSKIVKHQSDNAAAMKTADLEMQAQIQDYTLTMQKWQQSASIYQSEVNTQVEEFGQKLRLHLESWKTEEANAMQQYQLEVQDNIKTADIANQAHIQQAQLDLQVAIKDKDNNLQRELQNAINNMQELISENKSKISLYGAEVTAYQAEVASSIQEYTQNLQRYQAELQNSSSVFNEGNIAYQATIQKDLQNAQLSDSGEQRKISKYQSEIQGYQTEVNSIIQQNTAEISAWQNEWSVRTQKYSAEVAAIVNQYQAEIAGESQISQSQVAIYGAQINRVSQEQQLNLTAYQAEIQDSVNKFNELNVDFQADLQIALQDAQLSSQDDAQIIQKFQAETQNYSTEVGAIIQQNQAEISAWQSEWNLKTQKYSAEVGALVNIYQANLQNELNNFNEENVSFQADIQRKLAEYQSDIQVAIKNSDSETQVDLANQSQQVQAAVADYNAALQKYQTEISAYGAELAVYQADATSQLQKYQAELQADGVGYQWLQDQYNRLKLEYEQLFGQPAQPTQ